MTKDQNILLLLIGKAINPQSSIPLPLDINWTKVIEEATKQGLLGFCFDAVEMMSFQERPDMDSLMDWLGQVEYLKTEYHHKLDIVRALTDCFDKEGVRTTVLKGISYARYYKNSDRRYSCDFDCYLTDYDKGNDIAERLGAKVDCSEQKHSQIYYKGILIENHRELTGVSEDGFEQYLASMLFQEGNSKYGDTNIEMPSLLFDGLYCLYHAQGHFMINEGTQLRHIVDWVLIRQQMKKVGLFDFCMSDCKTYDLWKFANAMNGLADLLEGNKSLKDLTKAESRMLNDILSPSSVDRDYNNKFLQRIGVLQSILHNSWKYSLYTDHSAWTEIYRYLKRYAKRLMGANGRKQKTNSLS